MKLTSVNRSNFSEYCTNLLRKYNLANNYTIDIDNDDKTFKITFIKNGLRAFNGNNVYIENFYNTIEISYVNKRCKQLRMEQILFDWRNMCFKMPEISNIKIQTYLERKIELIRMINKFGNEFLKENNITKYNITVEGKGERFLEVKIKEKKDLLDTWFKDLSGLQFVDDKSSYLIDLAWNKTEDEIFENVKKFIKKSFLKINLGENDKINIEMSFINNFDIASLYPHTISTKWNI